MKQRPGMITHFVGEDEVMVIPTEGETLNRVLSLNGSGGYVWNLLETERTFDELVSLLVEEYGITDAEARSDLAEFIKTVIDYVQID